MHDQSPGEATALENLAIVLVLTGTMIPAAAVA